MNNKEKKIHGYDFDINSLYLASTIKYTRSFLADLIVVELLQRESKRNSVWKFFFISSLKKTME